MVSVLTHAYDPWLVLTVDGELDTFGAPELRNAAVSASSAGQNHIVIDLSRVDFIDSIGLGAIIGVLKRCRQQDGELRVVCGASPVRRVMEMCKLDQAMVVGDDLAEVLRND